MDADLRKAVGEATSGDAPWLSGEFAASLMVTVSGAPGGDLAVAWQLDGGSVTASDDTDADVTIEIAWKDALAVVGGEIVPAVAYMQGRLKPAGRMDVVLDLMEQTSSQDFRHWLASARS